MCKIAARSAWRVFVPVDGMIEVHVYSAAHKPQYGVPMKSKAFSFTGYGSARTKNRRPTQQRFDLESLEKRRLLDGTSALAHLDSSFGGAGAAAPVPGSLSAISGSYQFLTPAGDGKFYTVAYDPSQDYMMRRATLELMRVNADGSIDNSFGNAGSVSITHRDPVDMVIPWFSPGNTWHSEFDSLTVGSLIVQPDGKILLAVQAVPVGPPDPWLLMRFNPDGSTDTSFGDAGMVTLPLTDNRETPNAWVQPDGKIDLLGIDTFRYGGGPITGVLQQFNADGSPDTAVGDNGDSALSFYSDVIVDPASDGTPGYALATVIGGTATSDGGSIAYVNDRSAWGTETQHGGVIALRFDAAGNLVSSPTLYNSNATGAYNITSTMQPDGKVVLVDLDSGHLIRFNVDGSPDTAFDQTAAGISTPTGFGIQQISVEADGEIILTVGDPSHIIEGLQRLNPDGSPDTTFAGGQPVFGLGDHQDITSIVQQPDGSLILSTFDGNYWGYDATPVTAPKGSQLLRLQPDGGAASAYDDQAAEAAVIIETTPPPPPPAPDPVPVDNVSDVDTDPVYIDDTSDDSSTDDISTDDMFSYDSGDPSADPTGNGSDNSQDTTDGYFDSPAGATVWNPNGTGIAYDG